MNASWGRWREVKIKLNAIIRRRRLKSNGEKHRRACRILYLLFAGRMIMSEKANLKNPNDGKPLVLTWGEKFIGVFEWYGNWESDYSILLHPVCVDVLGTKRSLYNPDVDVPALATRKQTKLCMNGCPIGINPIDLATRDCIWLKLDKERYDFLVKTFKPTITGWEKLQMEENGGETK